MGGTLRSGVGVVTQPSFPLSCPVLNSAATLWQLKLTKTIENLNEGSSLKDLWSRFFSASLQNIILIKVEGEQFHIQETEKLLLLKDTFKVPHPHTQRQKAHLMK